MNWKFALSPKKLIGNQVGVIIGTLVAQLWFLPEVLGHPFSLGGCISGYVLAMITLTVISAKWPDPTWEDKETKETKKKEEFDFL